MVSACSRSPPSRRRAATSLRDVRIAESTEEYGVLAAASIAPHLLERNRSVGLISWGQHREVIPAERESRQLFKILEALAVLRAHGAQPLAEVLAAESTRFGRNCTLRDRHAVARRALGGQPAHLLYRGVRAVVILLEPRSRSAAGARRWRSRRAWPSCACRPTCSSSARRCPTRWRSRRSWGRRRASLRACGAPWTEGCAPPGLQK
jgi:hypothetical protein